MPRIPMPILRAKQLCDSETPGDQVPWEVGDLAWFRSAHGGDPMAVTVDSVMKGHVEAPGEQVYECVFEDGSRWAVSAKRLRIR